MTTKIKFARINPFFIALLFTFISVSGFGNRESHSDKYQIHIDGNNVKTAIVECEMLLEDDQLYMSSIGANQFPSRWAHFIQDLEVRIIGADIVELNPSRDHHGMTAVLAARLMREICGKMASF